MNARDFARFKLESAYFVTRVFYLAIGWLGIGLGAIGIIMPLFPTAPFLLVSLWAFSRSSPEMAEKIRNHPLAGSFIRDGSDFD